MTTKLETVAKATVKQNIPDIQPGDVIRVHQKIKEGDKQRIQVFEGVVLARKHGVGINATITVRKIESGLCYCNKVAGLAKSLALMRLVLCRRDSI